MKSFSIPLLCILHACLLDASYAFEMNFLIACRAILVTIILTAGESALVSLLVSTNNQFLPHGRKDAVSKYTCLPCCRNSCTAQPGKQGSREDF